VNCLVDYQARARRRRSTLCTVILTTVRGSTGSAMLCLLACCTAIPMRLPPSSCAFPEWLRRPVQPGRQPTTAPSFWLAKQSPLRSLFPWLRPLRSLFPWFRPLRTHRQPLPESVQRAMMPFKHTSRRQTGPIVPSTRLPDNKAPSLSFASLLFCSSEVCCCRRWVSAYLRTFLEQALRLHTV